MENIEQQLRAEIMAQLKRVTTLNAPNVLKLIQTESGFLPILFVLSCAVPIVSV